MAFGGIGFNGFGCRGPDFSCFRFNGFGLGGFIPGGLGGFRLDAVVVLVLAIQMWKQAADSLACDKNSGKYL